MSDKAYIIKREYLGETSVRELMKRIIRQHNENNTGDMKQEKEIVEKPFN